MQALVVPASYTEDADNDLLRTVKVGSLGRAAAVFGIPEIRVYEDPCSDVRDGRFVATLLSYQATAPYLRRRLFPLREELENAGALPPLNTPTHHVGEAPAAGEVRQGVVLPDGSVDVGGPEPGELPDPPREGETLRVEVEALDRGRPLLSRADGPPGAFAVRRAQTLAGAVGDLDPAVGTSVEGEGVDALRARTPLPDGGVAFGPPGRGLEPILEAGGSSLEDAFDVVVNTVPGQRTRTVRTEEAVWVTLGLVNALEAGLG